MLVPGVQMSSLRRIHSASHLIAVLTLAFAPVAAQAQVGVITTAAGGYIGDGGPAASAFLNSPQAVAAGPNGVLYIADSNNHRIRRVDSNGTISTAAGNGNSGFSGDGGSAPGSQLWFPHGIAAAPDGSLYIADTYNHRIRRIAPDGRISTVAGIGVYGFSGDGGT